VALHGNVTWEWGLDSDAWPIFVMLLPLPGKTNGSKHRKRNCHLTVHLHGMLCNILGDDTHSMFNVLAFADSIRNAKYISLAEFYVFVVILTTVSFYSYCYFRTSNTVPYTAWLSHFSTSFLFIKF
jgi:hypothetical protein